LEIASGIFPFSSLAQSVLRKKKGKEKEITGKKRGAVTGISGYVIMRKFADLKI